MPDDWKDRLQKLIQEHLDVPEAAIAATRSLLNARGRSARQPDEIARGYWPTVCLFWTTDQGTVEVEVSATAYEYSGPSERLDIRRFEHAGEPLVSNELLALVPT
ncbi:MAG: hypothetical protein ABIO40_04700 [Devosia sp.]